MPANRKPADDPRNDKSNDKTPAPAPVPVPTPEMMKQAEEVYTIGKMLYSEWESHGDMTPEQFLDAKRQMLLAEFARMPNPPAPDKAKAAADRVIKMAEDAVVFYLGINSLRNRIAAAMKTAMN